MPDMGSITDDVIGAACQRREKRSRGIGVGLPDCNQSNA
jgi:hypothetical protein